MNEDKNKSEQKPKGVFKKILAVQKLIQPEQKKGKNTYQNYAFLSDEQITNTVKEHSDSVGLIMMPTGEVVESTAMKTAKGGIKIRTKIKLTYEFIDPDDGSSYIGTWPGEAEDSQDKGTQKAITSAVKYMYIKVFKIAVEDDTDKSKGCQTMPTQYAKPAPAPAPTAPPPPPPLPPGQKQQSKFCTSCRKVHNGVHKDCYLCRNKKPKNEEQPPLPNPED